MTAARRILLLGATGFIGSEIAKAMVSEGHRVTGLCRDIGHGKQRSPELAWISADLRDLQAARDWQPHLVGIDVIINASGALQNGFRDNVSEVQAGAITALITAASTGEIGNFIQVSAAGANLASSDFMASKAEADGALIASAIPHTILRPGLVIGRNAFGGTEMVRIIAGFPWLTPTVSGTGQLQCIALSDVVAAVSNAVAHPANNQGSFDLVEEHAQSLLQIVELHRRWLGYAPPRFRLVAPLWAFKPISLVADLLGWFGWRSPLRRNSISALMHGVSGNYSETNAILGREPLSLAETLNAIGSSGKADRWHSRGALVFPFALTSLILLWFGSGILGLVRGDVAVGYLASAGMDHELARDFVLAGSVADLIISVALLFRPTLRWGLVGAILVTIVYVVGSLLVRPDLWLDPLGPMLKALPALALTFLCLAIGNER